MKRRGVYRQPGAATRCHLPVGQANTRLKGKGRLPADKRDLLRVFRKHPLSMMTARF